MARGEDADSALGAIDRAKALLVQTATFEMPVTGTTCRMVLRNATMSIRGRARSNIAMGDKACQVPPAEMPSFEAARAEAIRCAIDMLVDLQPGADDLTGWLVRVRDQGGHELCAIDVAEAQAARQANDNTPR